MYIAPNTTIFARALLFDMDGTLVDSTAVVERIWGRWAREHGIALESFSHTMHGRRAIDTMRDIVPPGVDPEAEVKRIDEWELVETEGIVAIPGAAELIASLPRGSWALVTSAQPALARARLTAAGLPVPEIMVTSLDVGQGKPDPACYLKALEWTGVRAEEALVFEDAPAGIEAGRRAGCRTIALCTTTPVERLGGGELLPDLAPLMLDRVLDDGRLQLRVR